MLCTNKLRSVALLVCLFLSQPSEAQFSLAKIFGSGMVLQREQLIHIWGKGIPAQSVTGRFSTENQKTTIASDSSWHLVFKKQKANAVPQTIRITSNEVAIELTNILIGDVWISAGQSNMAFMLKNDQFARQTLPHAQHPNLRLLNWQAGLTTYNSPYKPAEISRLKPENFYAGSWQMADSLTARDFSAVAFYFGQMVQASINIPIGLIHLAVGGSPCEAWMRAEAVKADAELAKVFRGNWLKNNSLEPWCIERGHQNLDNLINEKSELLNDSLGYNHPFKPTFLYQAGIEPLLNFPIKGVIWYQGESNSLSLGRVNQHEKLFPLLIKDWRKNWKQGDFPFYFCQLSSIGTEKGYKSQYWPEFRDSQRRIAATIPNVGMVVTSDYGHPSDVHPTNKKVIGERLARLALATTYRQKIAASGPVFLKVKKKTNQFILIFQYTEKELKTADNQAVRGFELEEASGKCTKVQAIIKGKTIIIPNNKSTTYRRLLYAWQPYTTANLINSEGLPASTFVVEL